MELVFDIEANNLLNSESIDYSQYPFKLKDTFKVHCVVFKDINTGEKYKFYQGSLTKENIHDILSKADKIVAHNGINYDLGVLLLYFDVNYYVGSGEGDPDKVLGKPCEIVDTLVISRALWPDRPSGHSLREWGKRLGILKGSYGESENAWEEFSQEMLEYCEQDVDVTEQVYYSLQEEQGDWPWKKALDMEKAISDIIFRQEHFGFKFNKELAKECLEDLNKKLTDIEERVEPLLPPKILGKTELKKFTPPKTQVKKDGQLSAHMEGFVKKMGAKVVEDKYGERSFVWEGEEYPLPLPSEPIKTTGHMQLCNQKELKEYLVSLGWNPTVWADSDLTVDAKKRKVGFEKYKASVYRYCMETKDSEFRKYRLVHAKAKTVKELYQNLMRRDLDRPVKVITSPKYTVDQEKTLCPNLTKLGQQVDFVTDVVLWLTYRHRRNSILSPNGTGFLAQPRIEVDGRIQTPAIACGAATSRMQHRVCSNIPRATSLYGAPMREMFTVEEGCYQIGCDASGLEARVEGHYTMPYDLEKEYVRALLSEKPDDIHSANAKKMGVSRDDAKTLKYASSYGAQPPKIAKQMDWSLSKAQRVFDDFWEAASPLADLKQRVSQHWKTKGQKKFIKGIDGRKLYTRSEHSLINLLFQSCGVIIMKKAAVMVDRWLREEGLLFNPFKDGNFKGRSAEMIHYHDEYQNQVCKSLVEMHYFDSEEDAGEFLEKQPGEKRWSDVSHVDDQYVVGYSRVGELMALGIKEAAKYYGMRVEFDGDYQIGYNWKHCH